MNKRITMTELMKPDGDEGINEKRIYDDWKQESVWSFNWFIKIIIWIIWIVKIKYYY